MAGPRNFFRIVSRTAMLLFRGARLLLLGLILPRQRRPQLLRHTLQSLGGLYIKLGQLLALQPDILSQPYCRALYDLLDRVPPFDYEAIERTFREDLGQSPAALFDDFETHPLSAASVGQVHLATLGGRRLAVKVRRPDVDLVFGADLALMEVVRRMILGLRWHRLGWLAQMLEELATWTREELDFTCEARFMAALEILSRPSPRERVPRPVDELSSQRLLVAEFLDGPTVLAYLRHRDHPMAPGTSAVKIPEGFDPDGFAANLVHNFVTDAFENGLFHADLHPANLLILPGNVVGYVDFGITGSLSRHSRRHIVQLTLALTQGDAEAMLFHFLRLSHPASWADLGRFEQRFRRLAETWHGSGEGRLGLRKSFTQIMIEFLTLSRQTGVLPGLDTVRYLRSILAVEGLIHQLAPRLDIEALLVSVCRDVLSRDLARQLRPLGLTRRAMQGARWLLEGPPRAAIALRRLGHLRAAEQSMGQGTSAAGTVATWVTLVAWGVLTLTGPPGRFALDMAWAAVLVGSLGLVSLGRLLSAPRP